MNFDFNKRINVIDKEIEKELVNLPDEVIETFVNKSIIDAKNIIKNDNTMEVQKVAYIIYRAYILGLMCGKKVKF